MMFHALLIFSGQNFVHIIINPQVLQLQHLLVEWSFATPQPPCEVVTTLQGWLQHRNFCTELK